MSAVLDATTDGAVWNRLIEPTRPAMPAEAAQYFLTLKFTDGDREQMHELAKRHQAGDLTPSELESLQTFRRVALQLDLLHAQARASLRQVGNGQHS